MAASRTKSAWIGGGLAGALLVVAVGLAALWFDGPGRSDGAASEGQHGLSAASSGAAAPTSGGGGVTAARARDGQGDASDLLRPDADERSGARVASSEVEAQDASSAAFERVIAVRGSVRDARDGLPVEDVEVRLESTAGSTSGASLRGEARTNTEGEFELRWGAGLAADLSLLHASYVDARRPDVPLEDFLELSMSPSARISGQVLGAAAALALAEDGARPVVLAWHASTSSARLWEKLEAPLSEGGTFAFEDLAGGDYVLTAAVPGRAVPLVAGVHVEAGEERAILLEAMPSATVEGRVLRSPPVKGEAPLAIAGARLSLDARVAGLPDDALVGRSAESVSDERGDFLFEGFAPGTYRLSVMLPWGERTKREVVIDSSGETQVVEVVCRAPASLGGRLVDRAGEPVKNASLAVFPLEDRQRRAQLADWSFDAGVPQARSDASGDFRFEDVPARVPLTVAVRRPEPPGAVPRAPMLVRVRPLQPDEQRLDEELVLPRAAVLTGRVLGPDGNAVADAKVELYRQEQNVGTRLALTRTAASGDFELRGIPTGRAVVFASALGLLSVREHVNVKVDGADVELYLQESLVIEGLALDEQGVAIAGVPIQLAIDPETPSPEEHAKRRRKHVSVSDAFGRFRFESLFDAEWVVSGGSYEWKLVGADPGLVTPSLSGWTTLTFAPRDRAERFTIRGRVEGAGGVPPSGLRIEGLRGGVLEIDAGRFVATGVTPTRHRLIFHGDGHRRKFVGPLAPKPGGEVDLGLVTLELACRVTVRVLDDKGRAHKDATVLLAPLSLAEGGPEDQRRVTLTHESKGRYQTGQAARARYRLIVRADGFANHAERLALEDSPAHAQRVRLRRP